MRATILLSTMLLCGALLEFPGVEFTPWDDSTYKTLAAIILIAFGMDVCELVKGGK